MVCVEVDVFVIYENEVLVLGVIRDRYCNGMWLFLLFRLWLILELYSSFNKMSCI